MRTVLTALLLLLAAAAPAAAGPSHAQTGVVIAENLERGPDGRIGSIEAAATADLGVTWGSVYVSWKGLQPGGPEGLDAGQVSVFHDRFAALRDAGRKVNVTFLHTPQWASGNANEHYAPTDPQAFGNFVALFAQEFGAEVDGYELGNEPDGGHFWLPGPDPVKYAGYAKAGLEALRLHDPTAVKFIGATAGANDEFIDQVLATGITGYDAVAFHSGTACKLEGPDKFIREAQGNPDIHGNSFTGYREIAHTMRARGIASPVLADTGAGWSTTKALCDRGASKGAKAGGVDHATQAAFVRDMFGCLEQDPEVKYSFLFSLYDKANDGVWDHEMGLIGTDRVPKESYRALKAVIAGGKPAFSGFCGGYVDHEAPDVTLTTTQPVAGGAAIYAGALPLSAKGTDEHPVTDIDLFADGKEIATSTKDGAVTMEWQGAKELKLGEHTITARARDEAGNVSAPATLKVRKVDPRNLPAVKTALKAFAKVRKGRKVTVSGALTWAPTIVKPTGQIRIWIKQGKFVSKYGAKANKGTFRKTVTLRKKGKWTVNVFYEGAKPFKKSRAKRLTIRVR